MDHDRTDGAGPPVRRAFDAARVEAALVELLTGIGEDPDRPGLRDTPRRAAQAYRDLFAGVGRDPADLPVTSFDVGHEELVLVTDVQLLSVCECHLLPFRGVAHVGYLPGPDGRVAGLSKFARLVDVLARRPQRQERLTAELAQAVADHLRPRGLLVVLECVHPCESIDDLSRPDVTVVTSVVRGRMRDPATRSEAMSVLASRSPRRA